MTIDITGRCLRENATLPDLFFGSHFVKEKIFLLLFANLI